MHRLSLVAGLLGSFLLACASSPAEEAATAEGAATLAPPTNGSGQDTIAGAYELQNDPGMSAGFTIKSVAADSFVFDLTAVTKTQGEHNGDVEDGVAMISNGYGIYEEEGCSIRFQFATDGTSADLLQTGACGSFGAFVDVSGHYPKK